MITALLLAGVGNLAPGLLIHTNVCSAEGCHSGMICAISPQLAYTAAHIVRGANEMIWESQFGERGRLELVDALPKEDGPVRVRTVSGNFPIWNVTGKKPKVGERLYWQGESWYAQGWYTDEGLYYGQDEDGDIIFGAGGHPGMSGGCVFNERVEAVGVLLGTVGIGAHSRAMGVPLRTYGAPIWRK